MLFILLMFNLFYFIIILLMFNYLKNVNYFTK